MFNKILMGENKDLNVLCFLWRYNYIDPIGDYRMNVNLFGKVKCLWIVIKLWQKWLDNLPDIQNVSLDRCYG